MPDYSEYLIVKDRKVECYNHYRGDYTFLCDMFWGEKEAKRIIRNQAKSNDLKSEDIFSRVIINENLEEVSFQIEIPENESGEGVLLVERYLDLVKVNWANWKVKYLEGGNYDVTRLLEEYNHSEVENLSPTVERYIPDYLEHIWDAPKGTLMSKEEENEITYEFLNDNIATIISKGEALLSQALSNQVSDSRLPFGGIHIDQNSRKISLWYTIEPVKIREWAMRYWNTWEVEFEFWGYENHYQRIGQEYKLSKIINKLEPRVIEKLKEQITSEDKEPYLDIENNTYSFRPREMGKEAMVKKFETILKDGHRNEKNRD